MFIPPENLDPLCTVCGRLAFSRHFGAYSCSACAAFFRRIVAKKKVYTCEYSGNCEIAPLRNQKICPACRFRKCISVGMQESQVLSLGPARKSEKQIDQVRSAPATVYNPALMPKPQKFDYSSNFSSYQNKEWLRNLILITESIGHRRKATMHPALFPLYKKTYIPDFTKYMDNELHFCQMYLCETGISDIAKDAINESMTNIYFYWNYLTMVLNTLQCDSIQSRKMTLLDFSMVEMSEVAIREVYATEPTLRKHLDMFVKAALPGWYRTEELVKKLRAICMTKEEQSCLIILCLIETITRLSSKPNVTRFRFKPLLESVFRSMHVYYRDNFSLDYMAIRMGELILAISFINEIRNIFAEQRTLVCLCDENSERFTPAALLKEMHSQWRWK